MTDMTDLADVVMDWALYLAFGFVAAAQIMAIIRLWIGPETGDRILALDTMFINAIGLIVLISIHQGTQIYFEAALIIAMLGFVSTVAYARFVLRGDIIE
jgi:multicomponent K+:H+ antiporter subunit F